MSKDGFKKGTQSPEISWWFLFSSPSSSFWQEANGCSSPSISTLPTFHFQGCCFHPLQQALMGEGWLGKEREEGSESLGTTLSTGRWRKAWAEHILEERSCSRGWACSTHGCKPRWRGSSPQATWAAGTCPRMIWLVLAGRNGVWEVTETPQIWGTGVGDVMGELLIVLAEGNGGVRISAFVVLLLLSPLLPLLALWSGKEEERGFGWNSSYQHCFCWDQLQSLRFLCPHKGATVKEGWPVWVSSFLTGNKQ